MCKDTQLQRNESPYCWRSRLSYRGRDARCRAQALESTEDIDSDSVWKHVSTSLRGDASEGRTFCEPTPETECSAEDVPNDERPLSPVQVRKPAKEDEQASLQIC
jgi:hypothetical protein